MARSLFLAALAFVTLFASGELVALQKKR